MRLLLDRLSGWFGSLLLAVILVGWGGGDAVAGGFTGPDSTLTISISADKTTLPINITGAPVTPGGPYTSMITAQAKQNGKPFSTDITFTRASGSAANGSLFQIDDLTQGFQQVIVEGTSTGQVLFHARNQPGVITIMASAADPNTGETISASLTITVTGGGNPSTGGKPSVVTFVMDPAPVYIRTNPDGTTPVSQSSVKLFQMFVRDDFGQPITQGTGNPLRIELLNSPGGGEWLSTTDAGGNAQEGTSVKAGLFGSAATAVFHSGTLPGTAVIAATADRADNNVDNGIQAGITSYATVSVGTGVITSLTFSGPFVDAVLGRKNTLGALLVDPVTVADPFLPEGAAGTLWNGIYTRFITVIASDPFGNPPPAGTPITFRLIDSPLDMLQNRYPDQGHGQFAITGYNGDPQEGGWEFFAPNRATSRSPGDTRNPFVVPNGVSAAIANPGCLLALQDPEIINPNSSTINALPSDGRLEYHIGSRLIIGRQGNMLTINAPFNQVSQNVGANIWYTVGCPPHKGNIMNFNTIKDPATEAVTDLTVMTDSNGVANTVMNYPASQVGRRFMVMAEANGGKVGAVMTHWYLGIPTDSILTITQPAQLANQIAAIAPITSTPWPALIAVTVTAEPRGEKLGLTLPVTFQVLDGGITSGGTLKRTPVPGVAIAVEIVITDPAETAAIVAAEAQAKAQAELSAFDEVNGTSEAICVALNTPDAAGNTACTVDLPDPKCALCETRAELQTALNDAKVAAATARAVADLHNPTASVVPPTLASGGAGLAKAVLQVNDLPTDGKVDFFFSTVGPEVNSETLQITVSPPAAEGE